MPDHTLPWPLLMLVLIVVVWMTFNVVVGASHWLRRFSLKSMLIAITLASLLLGATVVLLRS
jgi:choline-glycine betaine transporter